MEGYKEVYDTRDLTNLAPLLFPQGKQVFHPYTEIAPPEGNVIIKSFNFDTNTWQYDETVNTESYQYLSMVVANLMKENISFKSRLDALENPLLEEPAQPQEPEAPNVPEEGTGESDVSE